MKELRIIGIQISDRIKEAGRTQEILTKHSKIIRSRLGFHEVNDDVCSRIGFMLLQVDGTPEEADILVTELEHVGGLVIQQMKFTI